MQCVRMELTSVLLVEMGKTATEAHATSKEVYEKFLSGLKSLEEGRESIEDDPAPWTTLNIKNRTTTSRKFVHRVREDQSTLFSRGSDCPSQTSEETFCVRASPGTFHRDNAPAHSALSVKARPLRNTASPCWT